jgi:hypothetical protein
MPTFSGPPTTPSAPCWHDSTRRDGTLDCNCLKCGADGYWHDGHRHDEDHPSGKVLIRLSCLDSRAAALGEGER